MTHMLRREFAVRCWISSVSFMLATLPEMPSRMFFRLVIFGDSSIGDSFFVICVLIGIKY